MITPRDLIKSIYDMATLVYDNIQAAKDNREQCQRLADRVKMIGNMVKQLVAELPPHMLDTSYDVTPESSMLGTIQDALGITSAPITTSLPWHAPYGRSHLRYGYGGSSHDNSKVFVEALLELKTILEAALELAKVYADKLWITRVLRNGSHTEEFDAMFARLADGIQLLGFALNVQIQQSMETQAATGAHRHHEVVIATSALQTSMKQLFNKLAADMAIQQADRDAAERDRRMIIDQQKKLAQQYVDLQYDVRALGRDEAAHHDALAWQLRGISHEGATRYDRLAQQVSTLGMDANVRHSQLGHHLQLISRDEATHYGLLAQQLSSAQEEILRAVSTTKPPEAPIPRQLLVSFHELRIMRHIATGSFGKILRGRWSQHDAIIKVMEGPLTDEERQAFIKEVQLLKDLRSEHVMSIYAVCYEQGRLAYVMKYMSNGNLQHYLSEHALSVLQRYQIAYQIALGLKYLHDMGIINRDLKSTNILLDNGLNARITDFGLAEQAHLSLTLGERTVDIKWHAPEILNGIYKPNKASEVYSFGMILWTLITRKTPYAHLSTTEFMSQVRDGTLPKEYIPDTTPAAYRELIEACWHPAPARRPNIGHVISILRLLEKEALQVTVPVVSSRHQAGMFSSPSMSMPTPEHFYNLGTHEEQLGHISQAKSLYKLAAPAYPRAKTNLAFFYSSGAGGKAVKPEKAFKLWLEAAQQGHARAMVNVANCYRKGLGVLPNMDQAKYWEAQMQALLATEPAVSSSSSQPASSVMP